MSKVGQDYRYDGEEPKASFGVCLQKNKHGITPCGHRLLILPDNVETTTKSGIITSTGTQVLRDELAQIDGVVIEAGPDCNGWCKVGDRIVFGKYSGLFYTGKDNVKYRIVNDEDVVAVIVKGEK